MARQHLSAEEQLRTNCAEAQKLLHCYVDEELSTAESLEIESHLSYCKTCRAECDQIVQIKQQVRTLMSRTTAPSALRSKVSCTLEAAEKPTPRQVATAAALLLGVGLASFQLGSMLVSSPPPWLESSIAKHSVDMPVEIVGPSPERVSHWFQGKVAFPVRIPHFSSDIHLLGGRLSSVHELTAAQLMYEKSGKKITVLAFDPTGLPWVSHFWTRPNLRIQDRDVYLAKAHGYQVAFFQEDGVGYAVTTDLADQELAEFLNQGIAHQ